MKKIIVLIILLLFSFGSTVVNASNNNEIKNLYKKLSEIISPNDENKVVLNEKTHLALDCLIEILKKDPGSLEAYYALSMFTNPDKKKIIFNEKAKEKWFLWRTKYFDDKLNFDSNPVETLLYFALDEYCNDYKILRANDNIGVDLKSMSQKCKNENYRALAAAVLNHDLLYSNQKFIENFPDHLAIPFIKLRDQLNKVFEEDSEAYKNYYQIQKSSDDYKWLQKHFIAVKENYPIIAKFKNVNETPKLYIKYKEFLRPNGWKNNIDCYYQILNMNYEYIRENLAIIKEKYLIKSEALKGISEIKKLCKKYKAIVSPDGWKYEIYCYFELASIYLEIKDYDNYCKYYALFKEKCPNYPRKVGLKAIKILWKGY